MEEDKRHNAILDNLKKAVGNATKVFEEVSTNVKDYDSYEQAARVLIDLCDAYARLKYYKTLESPEYDDDDGLSPVRLCWDS